MAKMAAEKQRVSTGTIIAVVFLIIVSILLFKKPTITGKAVLGAETIYSENLNIKKNESGVYEWQVKNPGSIKAVKVTGSVSSNGTAKVFIQKGDQKLLLFDSTKQLFDIDIHVLPEYKSVFQGDEILVQIALLNLRGFGAGNVTVKYSIKDAKGNPIASDEESIFVETQAKFVRKLVMPLDIKTGAYVASVEVYRGNSILGTGSDTLEVKSKYEYKYSPNLKYYIIGIAGIVALAIISILIKNFLKAVKKKQKIAELKKTAPDERTAKLKKELSAMEEAYKSGFISRESYENQRKRIKDRLKVKKE
ncbi:hypothetical protein HYW20_00050 [Candidatus Woesearchaeota archaeon]|nr:hypothetical protein [Candidatus Woesearchaeota archaeon]